MYDLIIVGASAAGCSAAIYAARRGLNFKIVTDGLGGEVALSGEVGNWPGIKNIQGFDLAKNFVDHVRSYGVEIEEGYRVKKIYPVKPPTAIGGAEDAFNGVNHHFSMTAKNATGEVKTYEAKTVIIATGIHPRRLGVPGETEFGRKGVTYCTVCDGPLFKNKVTATVGSGNSALESAIMMSNIAKKVFLLSKYPNTPEKNGGFPPGENILIEKVKKLPNVEIIYGVGVTEIIGDKKVTGLKYRASAGEVETLPVDGVMVHVGQTPNSDFTDVEKDKGGQIIVDGKCRTSLPGIFAAGDVTNIPYKQIAIAAGQGVTAALAAIEYINRWRE